MVGLEDGDSVATQVVAAIRDAIVSGRLAPGSEIALAGLSEQFDVAMTTTRDALTRLVDQRLVVASEFGFRVTEASRAELDELTQLRQVVEGAAVRLSVERGDVQWQRRVREDYEALAALEDVADQPGVRDDWRAAHAAFHETLCGGADNERLTALAAALRDEAEVYRQLSGSALTQARREEVAHEHRSLMELALAGEAEMAGVVLCAHLSGTRDAASGSAWPDGAPR